jgi:hypothetical protein
MASDESDFDTTMNNDESDFDTTMNNDESDFDAEWDRSLFTASIPVIKRGDAPADDDWEARYNEDTTGFVSDPLTTSFTDLDLGPALQRLGDRADEADLDSWLDA